MSDETRKIRPYSGARQPLKVNAFEAAKSACSQLLPLFPYLGPDAIVPALGVSVHESGRRLGRFFHQNSVDEVGMCIGGGDMRPGTVWSTGRTHPVGRTDDEPEPPVGSHAVITVTQRHGVEEQTESFAIRCVQCQHLLLRHRYAFTPSDPPDGELESFATLVECANGAEQFNETEAVRTCSKCGHVNEPFPLAVWGWRTYRQNADAAERSRRALRQAAGTVTEGA